MNTNTHFNSGVVFNAQTNAIDVILGVANLGHIAHELKHAYQFETGEFSSGLFNNGNPFYDKSDELEAYKRGAMFGQPFPKKFDELYNKLKKGPYKVTDLGPEYLETPSKLQFYSETNKCAFRWDGRTYVSKHMIKILNKMNRK